MIVILEIALVVAVTGVKRYLGTHVRRVVVMEEAHIVILRDVIVTGTNNRFL